MVENISSTLNAKQTRTQTGEDPTLEPDSSFYLSINYLKTETHASVEGKNWLKAQPMGVNNLSNIIKDKIRGAGISTVVEKR